MVAKDLSVNHYEPFFQSTITQTEENDMNLKTDIPHLKDAGVIQLWDMALQNGHSTQNFHLAPFICCRVNVVWGNAKSRKGKKRKRERETREGR